MSWTYLFGLAALVAAEAWKAYKEEERTRNQQLTHHPKNQLTDERLNLEGTPSLMDCYEEVNRRDCNDRY